MKNNFWDRLFKRALSNLTVIRRVLVLNFFSVLVAVIVLIALINKVEGNTKRINNEAVRQEQKDARIAREASYRICERGNTTRAEIHVTIQETIGEEAAMARRIRQPILGCDSNFAGVPPRPLNILEQIKYEKFYIKHDGFPPIVTNGEVTNIENRKIILPQLGGG